MATGLPTAWFVEIEYTAGVWTDESANIGSPVVIRVGRSDAASDSQPGTCSFVLDNIDGTFTPDNPLSSRYPNLVEGKRVRVRVTKGTTSTRFVGRITSIEPDFPTEPTQCKTTITAVDLLGDLATMELTPALQMQVLSDSPVAYYPMDEPASSPSVSNIVAGGTISPLAPVPVGTKGDVAFGDSPAPTADGLTAPTFKPVGTDCVPLRPNLESSFGITEDLTIECWFSTTYNSSAVGGAFATQPILSLSTIKGPGALTDRIELVHVSDYSVTPPANSVTAFHYHAAAGGASAGNTVGVNMNDGNLHHFVFTEKNTAGSVAQSFYVDGVLQFAPGSGYTRDATHPTVTYRYLIAAPTPSIPFAVPFTGSVSNIAVYTSALTAAQILAHYNAGAPASTADTLSAQMARLTTITGVTAAFDVTSTKGAVCGPTAGSTALDALLRIVRGESGITYHDYATGNIVAPLESSARPTAVAMTVDSEADGQDGPNLSRSNTSRVASATGQSAIQQRTYTDATVKAQIGNVGTSIDTNLANANDLYAVASNRVALGRDQKLRLKQFTVDLVTAQTDLYASLFALRPGGRIRYMNLPSAYFGVTYIDGYAEGWTEEISTDGYRVTFDLSPADAPREAVLDTARYSWGDGVCTASSLTSSATSVVLTWTGTQALSTVAGDYPMDLNINGERVTVSAAPAGATSPQTVTIVRGVAPTVARAHSAGDSVDVWDCGCFAF